MNESKISSGKIYCLISAIIIFGCYTAQRAIINGFAQTRELAILQAIVFSLCVVIVYFLITKSEELFYGILMAVFGFRMLPPDIESLEQFSRGADALYFIVRKAALAIFAFAILKLYRKQKSPKPIRAVPIISLMVIVPYFLDISNAVSPYIYDVSGSNMLCVYFTGFAFYSLAMIVTLFIGMKTNETSAVFIADYQMVALLINAGRKICAVAINLINSNHVSKSYYCWIAIYIFFFGAFYIMKRKKVQYADRTA